jgi:hypothetical protein
VRLAIGNAPENLFRRAEEEDSLEYSDILDSLLRSIMRNPSAAAYYGRSQDVSLREARLRAVYAATVTTATWLVAGGTGSPAIRRPSM